MDLDSRMLSMAYGTLLVMSPAWLTADDDVDAASEQSQQHNTRWWTVITQKLTETVSVSSSHIRFIISDRIAWPASGQRAIRKRILHYQIVRNYIDSFACETEQNQKRIARNATE